MTTAGEGERLLIGGEAALRPLDAERAESWLRDLAERAAEASLPALERLLSRAEDPDRLRLGAVLDLSPYLNGLVLKHPEWLERLFTLEAGVRIAEIVADLGAPVDEGPGEAPVMAALRLARAEASLLIALRDLFGAAGVEETTRDLSLLAEAAVGRALRFCLLDADRRGTLRLPDRADPERGSGLFILGMGKLGGGELNYSSDIDLILFFEPEAEAVPDPAESVETFSRLARKLVRILSERTGDGYVFRTDLRLRPDPSAMPLAIPVETALTYYEASGRDWERAAMIKARPVAGDRAAAAAFLQAISPFVWRRYLDFAAIADIQAMKGRIDRHRGFEGIGVAGHNVKLGRGGIREVEFVAQIQQLIAAGRSPELRLRRTDETLAKLAAGGWMSGAAAADLTEAYWFLRRVEHAVQMVADEQTHTLPEDGRELLRIARLMTFKDTQAFSDALLDRLRTVEAGFSGLFSGRSGGAEGQSPLSALLNDAEDAAALEAIAAMGFSRPHDIARIVHGWGGGRYRAMRSEAAREHLTRVLPSLVAAFAEGQDPDAALAGFDRFLAGLPSGLQFFALIASNPRLLDLLALIITSAPRLAETISGRPHVFDALLEPAFYSEMPTRALIRDRLAAFLADGSGYEDALGRLRIFASEQRFLVGVRLLSGAIEGEAAGEAFSDLAEIVVEAVLETVEAEFAARHGRVAGGRLVVLGLGRLGSRELTANSDVDLMLLYDHAGDAEDSDGERPLPVSVYYARLTQRLIAALASPMAEGVLYEVDFRLRPSGNKGPLATHIDAFRKYQGQAWTWERMALTRSRPIAGDAALRQEICEAVRAAIREHHADPRLALDVAEMRQRIEREKPPRGSLDLKLLPGGLIDLEFIAQWAVLAGLVPDSCIGRPTAEILAALAAARPQPEEGIAEIERAMRRFTRITQLTRLGPGSPRTVADLPRGLAERLAGSLEVPDPSRIEADIAETAERTRAIFERLLPAPTETSPAA